MHPSRSYPRLLWFFLLSALFVAGVCAAFIRLIDPYGLNRGGLFVLDGLRKPEIYRYGIEAKQRRLSQVEPGIVIYGNSRVDAGIDPNAALWPDALRPVFNFGVPGTSLASLSPIITAQFQAPVRQHWIGIDAFDFFRTCRAANTAGDPPAAPAAPSKLFQSMQRHFSLTALLDAATTVFQQSNLETLDMTSLGLNPWAHIQLNYRLEGPYAVIQQRNFSNYRNFSRRSKTLLCNGERHPAWAYLEEILDQAAASGAKVTLFTHPVHSDSLKGLEYFGLWPVLEDFKRTLTQIADVYDAPLYDFTVVSPDTTEAFPKKSVRGDAMTYFYEAGHYRPALGNKMVAAMLSEGKRGGFGAKLDVAMIEPHLEAQRDAWLAFKPSEDAQARWTALIEGVAQSAR